MRPFLFSAFLFASSVLGARAAPDSDPLLQQGLLAMEGQTNGIQAACQVWYQDQPRLASEMEARIYAVSKDYGLLVGSEIVASQRLGSREERFYGVFYFERRPVWFMIERYVGREMGKDKPMFLSMKVSREADEILPSLISDLHT
jgi:hypothetical protein